MARKSKIEKEWEDYWFKEVNKLCEDCVLTCKQSSHVTVVKCPQRKLKEK